MFRFRLRQKYRRGGFGWSCLAILIILMTEVMTSSVSAQTDRTHFGISYSRVAYEATSIIQDHSVDKGEGERRVFGGHRLTDNLYIEGSWINITGFDGSFVTDVSGYGDEITLNFDADYHMVTARVLGILPKEKVNLFGGIGVYYSSFDARSSYPIFKIYSNQVEAAKTSESGATLIVGVEYKLPRISRVHLRLDYEWFDSESGIDVSAVSLGFVIRSR